MSKKNKRPTRAQKIAGGQSKSSNYAIKKAAQRAGHYSAHSPFQYRDDEPKAQPVIFYDGPDEASEGSLAFITESIK